MPSVGVRSPRLREPAKQIKKMARRHFMLVAEGRRVVLQKSVRDLVAATPIEEGK
jgi:hypothetical protein